jgi:hypothetical protein
MNPVRDKSLNGMNPPNKQQAFSTKAVITMENK